MSEALHITQFEKLAPKKTKSGKSRSDIARSAIRKGKNGERFCAHFLTEQSGLSFIRIPNSGARTGMTNRDRVYQYNEQQLESMIGDIYPPYELKFRYIIESKNYAGFPFKKLEQGKLPAKLERWLYEICYDTETYLCFKEKYKRQLREPLSFLFMKITDQGNWIIYNISYFAKVFPNITTHHQFNVSYEPPEKLKSIGFEERWFIEDFREFVKNNKVALFERSNIFIKDETDGKVQ